MRSTVGALATLLVAVTLAGCARAGTEVPPVAAADLETEISAEVEAEVGVAAEVACPGDLPAEVGAQVTCTIAPSDEVTEPLVAVATVTAVDTETGVVEFDIAVDTAQPEEPTPATSAPAEG